MPSDFRWHSFLVSAGYLPDTIDTSEKGDWFKVVKAGGISIAAASAFTVAKNFITGSKFYSNVSERLKRTPDNNGNWSGKRGDSKFNSNNPEVVDLEKN